MLDGAGNGLATRHLLGCGVSPLTLPEPEARFDPLLRALTGASACAADIRHEAFEEARLEPSFGLAVVATAFHWLEPATRVESLAQVVRPNGHVAPT